jgi:hypothetical protein
MTIAVFIVLCLAAIGCFALLGTLPSSPDTAGLTGAATWLAAIALFVGAACYLLTLAVGVVQP